MPGGYFFINKTFPIPDPFPSFTGMKKRPLSVTLIAALYILSGISGIVYHAGEWMDHIAGDDVLAFAVRVLAIVAGAYALRASAWARWVMVAWIAYHVFLSFFHSAQEIIVHLVVTLITIAALFNKSANDFFRKSLEAPGPGS